MTNKLIPIDSLEKELCVLCIADLIYYPYMTPEARDLYDTITEEEKKKLKNSLKRKENIMKIIKVYKDSCPMNPCGQGGIEFSDGTVLVDLHDQDCCENVYADFSNLDSDIMSYNFKSMIQIKEARHGFKFGDGYRWFFVPCYNEQNGYYNDALSIAYGMTEKRIIRYSKGKPIFGHEFVALTTLEGCPVENNYY